MMMPIPQVGWVTSIMLYPLMITPALHGSIFFLNKKRSFVNLSEILQLVQTQFGKKKKSESILIQKSTCLGIAHLFI